jgi:hypothetical protein
MDFGLRDRVIWIGLDGPAERTAFATVCLEEGARVALFSPTHTHLAQGAVERLRRRFGFAVHAAGPSGSAAVEAAIRWGGQPSGLIATLPTSLAPGSEPEFVRTCARVLAPGGAIALITGASDAAASQESTAALLEGLRTEQARWRVQAGLETRVSIIALSRPPADERAAQAGESPVLPTALAGLMAFLLGVGPGWLVKVDAAGCVHLV